ncbi:MAG: hypothetical protein NZM40_10755 [Sphingomonadaceae bacterium]|uniref:hypothetical protein n=1 Tax=Thermaurantiacus sp. TaxID=2820283 RepID=UPI00298F1648|nr:hypothetical protein [Thermaurantiacus sp.]MCS6987884.1 hypothetical protein [Sphingomonadaceae bacterium]MDW8414896.1 hypothetical protein [Thermaurantiacus sp.]
MNLGRSHAAAAEGRVLAVCQVSAVLVLGVSADGASPAALDPPSASGRSDAEPPSGKAIGRFVPYGRGAVLAVATAAAPGLPDLERAKALGFRHVIDLRSRHEPGGEPEVGRVVALGLRHTRLPFPEAVDGVREFVAALVPLLDDPQGRPLLLVCSTGARAAAAWTLYRMARGVPPQEAIEKGRAAGLTARFEAFVRMALASTAGKLAASAGPVAPASRLER